MKHPNEVRDYIESLPRESSMILSPNQEVEMFTRYKNGESHLYETILKHNLRLVVNIALKYHGVGVPIMDLIQEGNIGLMYAIPKFKLSKGFKFSTYATWWIRRAVLRTLSYESRFIRYPEHVIHRLRKIERAERDLQVQGNHEPTDENIFNYLRNEEAINELTNPRWGDLTDNEIIRHVLNNGEPPISLKHITETRELGPAIDVISADAPASTEDSIDALVLDHIPDPDDGPSDLVESPQTSFAFNQYLRKAIGESRSNSPERDYMILVHRYGLEDQQPKTLRETCSLLGVTRERIRQVQNILLNYFREEHPNLASFLDTPSL